MLKAWLSTPAYDPQGFIELNLTQEGGLFNLSRRVTIEQAIDGSTLSDDAGYAVGDREVSLSFRCTWTTLQLVQYLVSYYPQLHLATAEGFYLCAPIRVDFDKGEADLTLRFLSLLSA